MFYFLKKELDKPIFVSWTTNVKSMVAVIVLASCVLVWIKQFVGLCSSNSLATRSDLHLGLYSSLTSANNLNLPTLLTLFYFFNSSLLTSTY